MFYVKYKRDDLYSVTPPYETLEAAQAFAERLRTAELDPGWGEFEEVEVLLDVDTADQTARAMAFTPMPVAGRAGYGNWRD